MVDQQWYDMKNTNIISGKDSFKEYLLHSLFSNGEVLNSERFTWKVKKTDILYIA